jgi:hypothetical protein
MSIFASDTATTIPIPFDAPHTATIGKLTGRQLELAQAAHLKDFIGGNSPRGWPAIFKKAVAAGTALESDARHTLEDPLIGYDRMTIVRNGLKGWSYFEKSLPSAVEDLDDEALEFFAIEIMRITKPGLFLSREEREAARKND